ncbi:hypothetical protein [Kitasatospora sp. NPDC047058]|uniref:hypothetical protein n=1 Tax=Kitasatospora sp. NPDC047058 TaxID=3155620 RepID=UPI0033D2168F
MTNPLTAAPLTAAAPATRTLLTAGSGSGATVLAFTAGAALGLGRLSAVAARLSA